MCRYEVLKSLRLKYYVKMDIGEYFELSMTANEVINRAAENTRPSKELILGCERETKEFIN